MSNRDLERMSFLNLCKFYEEELRKILKGTSPMEVFPKATRRTLRRHGVLENQLQGVWGVPLVVSKNAMEILGFNKRKTR